MSNIMTFPSSVLFREIYKNAWLRKLPAPEKKTGVIPKKGERVWTVFCVHDDTVPFLESYTDQKLAATHKPDWYVSLSSTLHISPTICPNDEEYEFVITFPNDAVHLFAPSWNVMTEWVDVLGIKLREMKILSPKENVYSRMPEFRQPLLPTRDPNSPLPLPPEGPSALVPGVEPLILTNPPASTGENSREEEAPSPVVEERDREETQLVRSESQRSGTSTSSVYIAHSDLPVFFRSHSVPETSPPHRDANVTVIQVSAANSSSNAPLTSPPTFDAFDFDFVSSPLNHEIIIDGGADDGGRIVVIDEEGEEEFFTPPVTPVFPSRIRKPITINPIPRPRPSNRSEHHGRQRAATTAVATDDSQHQNDTRCVTSSSSGIRSDHHGKQRTATTTVATDDSQHQNDARCVCVTSLSSGIRSEHHGRQRTATTAVTTDASQDQNDARCVCVTSSSGIQSEHHERQRTATTAVVTDDSQHQNDTRCICVTSSSSGSRSEHHGRRRTATSSVVTDDSQNQNDTRCICVRPSSSGVNVTSSSSSSLTVSVSARPQTSQDSTHLVNHLEANHQDQLSSVQNGENNIPSQATSEQPTSQQTDLDSEANSHYEHVFLSSSQFSPATVVMPDTVPVGGHLRGHRSRRRSTENSVPAVSSSVGVDRIRRLQQPPHPFRQGLSVSESNTSNASSRLTLREQQVLQLRREIMHPGGIRLQLRRKDCLGSIAFVDAYNAVWVAGWKQKEHPMLYNALHIGDQIRSIAGVVVHNASDAHKLIRGAPSLYVEFIIRRVPCGRVFALRRESEGQSIGIVLECNTAEVKDVIAGSIAANQGLSARTPTLDSLSLTNWVITEVNGRPLNLFFKDGEVKDRLNAVGLDISLLVQPSDLIKQIKKQLKAMRSYKDYIVQ